jgi:preprotein translocase subunit SecF
MEFFKQKTNIDFMGLRKWTAILSLLLFAGSLGSLWINGLTWGLDFTGGTQVQLHYPQAADLGNIRTQLKTAGFDKAVVQSYGSTQDVLVTLQSHGNDDADQKQLSTHIRTALPDAAITRLESVGSQVGKELATRGALAILVALLGTMAYIAFRFEYRFAVSSALALVHDPVLILGIFSLCHIEFNLVALAAVLAVIGYSLNDTIVIFDRTRENFRKVRKGTPLEIMNLSINQTLSRTLMTSGMTLVVVSVLFFYGGDMIHGFATALIIGIVVGTYSSIYVAGALAIAMGLSKADLMPPAKQELDNRP